MLMFHAPHVYSMGRLIRLCDACTSGWHDFGQAVAAAFYVNKACPMPSCACLLGIRPLMHLNAYT